MDKNNPGRCCQCNEPATFLIDGKGWCTGCWHCHRADEAEKEAVRRFWQIIALACLIGIVAYIAGLASQ